MGRQSKFGQKRDKVPLVLIGEIIAEPENGCAIVSFKNNFEKEFREKSIQTIFLNDYSNVLHTVGPVNMKSDTRWKEAVAKCKQSMSTVHKYSWDLTSMKKGDFERHITDVTDALLKEHNSNFYGDALALTSGNIQLHIAVQAHLSEELSNVINACHLKELQKLTATSIYLQMECSLRDALFCLIPNMLHNRVYTRINTGSPNESASGVRGGLTRHCIYERIADYLEEVATHQTSGRVAIEGDPKPEDENGAETVRSKILGKTFSHQNRFLYRALAQKEKTEQVAEFITAGKHFFTDETNRKAYQKVISYLQHVVDINKESTLDINQLMIGEAATPSNGNSVMMLKSKRLCFTDDLTVVDRGLATGSKEVIGEALLDTDGLPVIGKLGVSQSDEDQYTVTTTEGTVLTLPIKDFQPIQVVKPTNPSMLLVQEDCCISLCKMLLLAFIEYHATYVSQRATNYSANCAVADTLVTNYNALMLLVEEIQAWGKDELSKKDLLGTAYEQCEMVRNTLDGIYLDSKILVDVRRQLHSLGSRKEKDCDFIAGSKTEDSKSDLVLDQPAILAAGTSASGGL